MVQIMATIFLHRSLHLLHCSNDTQRTQMIIAGSTQAFVHNHQDRLSVSDPIRTPTCDMKQLMIQRLC